MESYSIFRDLAIIIIFAKVFGIIARKCKAPQVVGEIIAGLLIGPSVLGLVQQSDFLIQMAEIGVILLMFSAGLETNLRDLMKTGFVAFLIACFGVFVPLVGGTLLYMGFYGVAPWGSEKFYEAVFIGSGAGLPMFMNIPGENLKGVYSANEFLTRINLMKAYREDSDTPIMDLKGKTVAVVGGGNVAIDAARCSKRLGAEVYVVYRRGMEELPARHEEVEHAIEEGVIFKTLNNPVQINGDEQDCVKSMTCIEMELGEPDASGRRRPVEKKGSEFDLPVDAVIMSLGTTPNPLIKATTKGLEVNKKGCIIVNEDGLTSREGVYAGGDAVTGAATVILAMGAGKLGAKSIDEYLSK